MSQPTALALSALQFGGHVLMPVEGRCVRRSIMLPVDPTAQGEELATEICRDVAALTTANPGQTDRLGMTLRGLLLSGFFHRNLTFPQSAPHLFGANSSQIDVDNMDLDYIVTVQLRKLIQRC